jgi:hypothetical protein
MAAMQTVSARIPTEDLEWLATLNVQGASTPSDKIRALVAQLKRQHEGAVDYGASLTWMRDLVAPFVTRIGALEHRQGNHSEVVRLVAEWLPQTMALIVAENGGGALTQPKAQQIEERLIAKVFQLITGILRLSVTQTADCYDPRALEKHLAQVVELVGVIAANRGTTITQKEQSHG